jgi:hypothetical protein
LCNGYLKLTAGGELKKNFQIGTFLAPENSFSLDVREKQKRGNKENNGRHAESENA